MDSGLMQIYIPLEGESRPIVFRALLTGTIWFQLIFNQYHESSLNEKYGRGKIK